MTTQAAIEGREAEAFAANTYRRIFLSMVVLLVIAAPVLWVKYGRGMGLSFILGGGIAFSWNPTPFAHGLAAVFVASALVHAGASYGARPALVLFIVCLAITFAMELEESIGVGHVHPPSR